MSAHALPIKGLLVAAAAAVIAPKGAATRPLNTPAAGSFSQPTAPPTGYLSGRPVCPLYGVGARRKVLQWAAATRCVAERAGGQNYLPGSLSHGEPGSSGMALSPPKKTPKTEPETPRPLPLVVLVRSSGSFPRFWPVVRVCVPPRVTPGWVREPRPCTAPNVGSPAPWAVARGEPRGRVPVPPSQRDSVVFLCFPKDFFYFNKWQLLFVCWFVLFGCCFSPAGPPVSATSTKLRSSSWCGGCPAFAEQERRCDLSVLR